MMRILAGILLFSHLLLAQQPSQPAASALGGPRPGSTTGCAQPASIAQVQKMMDLAGSKKALETAMSTIGQQLFDTFKKMQPDIPPQAWDVMLAHFESPETVQGLLTDIIPIYQRHFCSDEIEQIIAFYQSPAGKKLAAETPAIQRESAEAGQNYFRSIRQQLMQEIQAELAKQGTKPDAAPKAPDNSPPKQ